MPLYPGLPSARLPSVNGGGPQRPGFPSGTNSGGQLAVPTLWLPDRSLVGPMSRLGVPVGFTNAGGPYYDLILGEANLVGFWRGDENASIFAIDSKAGLTGTWAGAFTRDQASLLVSESDPCSLFAIANTNKIDVSGVPDLSTGITVEAWLKRVDSLHTDRGIFGRPGAATADYGFYWQGSLGQLSFFGGSTGGVTADGAHTGVWDTGVHLVHAVFDGTATGWKLYQDGADITGTVSSGTMVSNTGAITWGVDVASDFWGGNLSNMALYSVALSPSTILNHYNVGAVIAAADLGYPDVGGGYYPVAA